MCTQYTSQMLMPSFSTAERNQKAKDRERERVRKKALDVALLPLISTFTIVIGLTSNRDSAVRAKEKEKHSTNIITIRRVT